MLSILTELASKLSNWWYGETPATATLRAPLLENAYGAAAAAEPKPVAVANTPAIVKRPTAAAAPQPMSSSKHAAAFTPVQHEVHPSALAHKVGYFTEYTRYDTSKRK